MPAQEQPQLNLASGTIWMIGMRWSMRLAGLVSTIILARLLAPEDFGIIAMAKVAVGFVEAMSTSGTQLALIRTPDRSRELYDTAWTINLLQRAIMAGALFLAAPLAVAHFDEPRTLAVIQVLAIATLIRGFFNIGTVNFRKDLDFAAEFRFGVLEKLTGVMIAITLAVLLRNYWALTLAITFEAIAAVILSYVLHPYRPKLCLSRWSDLWRFSFWILVNRLAFFGNSRLDQLMVGGSFSTLAMGYYNVGSEIGTLPGDEVAEPLRRAVYPNLSTLTANKTAFAKTTIDVFGVAAFFLVPIGFGLAAIAPTFISVVLGEKWLQAAPVLSIASLYGAVAGLAGVLELPLLVLGRARLSAFVAWVQVVLLVPAILLTIKLGNLTYVASSRAIVVVLGFLIMAYAVSRLLRLSILQFFSSSWRSLIGSAIMYGVVVRTGHLSNNIEFTTLLLLIGVGMVAYVGIVAGLWIFVGKPDGPESYAIRWLTDRLDALRGKIS